MADTLESLEIEVKHSASGAADELNNIATAISKIGGALTRALPKLAKLADTLSQIGNNITINDIHDSTFQKVTQSASKAAKAAESSPLSEELRDQISQAGKLEIAVHKAAKAGKDMQDAFDKGNENAAWRAREQEINANASAERERAKAIPKPEVEAPVALSQEMQDLISSASQIDLLQAKLVSLRAAMQEAFEAGNADKAMSLRGQILQTEAALEKAEKAANGAAESVKNLSKEAKKSQSPLANFVSSLKRIAFYRMIRSIIKSITAAFQEGLKNAYAFSAGITTEGHRFAAALDGVATSGLTLENQLGSAFIRLYAALAPVINQLIALIVRLADALSQIFSAFTGSTYLKAVEAPKQWGEAAGGAAKAAKEWKNQLLGFDEINRLEAPSDGGGSGAGGGLDPSAMFEDTPIAEKYRKFAEAVKSFLQWCKDHLDLIKGIVEAIGIALLAWKIGSFLNELLGLNLSLSTIVGIALTLAGVFLLIRGVLDAIENGVNWDNMAEMILGVALAAGGLYLAFGSVAGAIGLLVGSLVILGVGVVDWLKKGELTEQSFWLIEAGIVGVGAALSLMTGSWIPLAVAAVAASIAAIIRYWDQIIAKLKSFQKMLHDALHDGKLNWMDFAAVAIQALLAPIDAIIQLINWISTAISWIISLVNAWNGAQSSIAGAQAMAGSADYGYGLFASGGFPDEGQMFIARESGAEMVGTIGGRTAVANNDQIVAAIEGGVFRAMSAAMSSNGGSGNHTTIIDINGREFFRATYNDQKAVAKERGISLIANG